jgi:multisubunit Na+/H+ antiporter MnhB subunit
MNMDDKSNRRSLTKTAIRVLLGFILVIVLLNVPGISLRYITLVSSAVSFLLAGYYYWPVRAVEAEKRRMAVAVYTFLGLIALLITSISWSLPITTPVKPTVSIGLLAGGVLGVILIRVFARMEV